MPTGGPRPSLVVPWARSAPPPRTDPPTRRQLLALALPGAAALIPALGGVPAARAASARRSRGTWSVTDFGASGGGKVLATRGIQAAVDACGKAGGGVVLVPPGRYL